MNSEKLLNYFKSSYFNAWTMLSLAMLGGFIATFFPFNDLSFEKILRTKVLFVYFLASLMAGICVLIVSMTWYNFRPGSGLGTVIGYILFGGLLPIGLILAEISLVFGVDILFKHDMQYHLWFYAALIYISSICIISLSRSS